MLHPVLRPLDLRAILSGKLRQGVHRRLQATGEGGRIQRSIERPEAAVRLQQRAGQGGAPVRGIAGLCEVPAPPV
jgi:hypothetical protein